MQAQNRSTPADETEIIRRASRGDPSAWEELVRRYQEAVFRIAYLILADAAAAEDAAQETFLRAYNNLDKFDLSRPLRPWLLKIASNQAKNRMRSIRRYFYALQRAIQEAAADDKYAAPAEVDQIGEYQDLWEAIQSLSLPDQQIIYYRFYLDLPVAETAEALGIAEGTVKSRLSRALARLKDTIGRDFPQILDINTRRPG